VRAVAFGSVVAVSVAFVDEAPVRARRVRKEGKEG